MCSSFPSFLLLLLRALVVVPVPIRVPDVAVLAHGSPFDLRAVVLVDPHGGDVPVTLLAVDQEKLAHAVVGNGETSGRVTFRVEIDEMMVRVSAVGDVARSVVEGVL